jgi:hypothetical protein
VIRNQFALWEDDPNIGPVLKQLATRRFTDHQVVWAKNAMAALTLVQQHASALRLVVLDVKHAGPRRRRGDRADLRTVVRRDHTHLGRGGVDARELRLGQPMVGQAD